MNLSTTALGEHVVLQSYPDSLALGLLHVAKCRKCGAEDRFTVEAYPWYHDSAHREVARRTERFLKAHLHESPRPLTAEEREKVRVRGIHRRGALRCGYGARP